MERPVTFHTVPNPGRHYPGAGGSPVQAMLQQQQYRADQAATRQQMMRLFLGGRRPPMTAS